MPDAPPVWPRRIRSGAAFLCATGTAAALATLFGAVSARTFGIRYETLPILAPESYPLRILHISDMHLVTGDRKKIDFVRGLQQLQPDLIVNTGDNPGDTTAIDDVLQALEPHLEIPGVFVPGSNDFFGPHAANPLRYLRAPSTTSNDDARQRIDTRRMHTAFTQSGRWHAVANRTLTVEVDDGRRIQVAGTHDAHLQADRWPGFAPPTSSTDLTIAVTHAPYRRVLDAAVTDRADLVFAGHTHGGQVALPRYGAIVSNCDLPTGLAAGLFPWRAGGKQAWVNVSAGIGAATMVPLRTFCPPEAVVIDVVAAPVQGSR